MEASPTIELTASAVEKLIELRGDDPAHAILRLFVTGRTCCGYRHGLLFAERADPEESLIEVSGMRIAVDIQGPPYREGATIDYVEIADGVGFAVRTPNASSGCTCDSG